MNIDRWEDCMRYERCYCGATDCPECGPAQGYRVVRTAYGWRNPEPDEVLEPVEEYDDWDEYKERLWR